MSQPYQQPVQQSYQNQQYQYPAQPQQQYPQQTYPQQQYPQQGYQQQQQPYNNQVQYQQVQQPYYPQQQGKIDLKPSDDSGAQQKNPFVDYGLDEYLLSTVEFDQRKKFIVKVYTIISIQLFVTFALCLIAYFSQGFRDLMINPYNYNATPFYWVCFAISIVTEIAIFCCKKVARKVPNNYIALSIFTLSFSVVVAGSCAVCYDAFSNGGLLVVIAAAMTFAVTVALTVYAIRTKTDFTMAGGALFILSAVMLMLFIFAIFFFNIILWLILCAFSVVLYGFYLIYDTQLIVGGKSHQLSIDDYVVGALFIYIDIIILFLRILQILMILFGKK